MSTQLKLNKSTRKKIKLDEVKRGVSSVADFKRYAILRYCDENGIEKNQLDILSIPNKLQKIGISYCFITSIISSILELYENFYML